MKVPLLVALAVVAAHAALLPATGGKTLEIDVGSTPDPPLTTALKIDKGKTDQTKVLDLSKLDPTPKGSAEDKQIPAAIGTSFACNQKLLRGFGLNGHPFAQVEPHRFCPNITRNCCTQTDEDLTMDFWKNRDHLNVDRYYRAYQLMVSYLLGYSKEGAFLQKQFRGKQDVCGEAAAKFESLNVSRVLIEKILEIFKRSIKSLATLRTGFYCNLCEYNTNSLFKGAGDDMGSGSLQVSQATCKTLIEDVVPASYYMVTYVRQLLESIGTMINCKTGVPQPVQFEVPDEEAKAATRCFEAKDRFTVADCDSFCGQLRLNRPAPLIDGYVDQFFKFFLKFYENKKAAFEFPEINVFVVSPDFEENAIKADMAEVQLNRDFFRPMGVAQVKLENFATSVSEIGGAELWDNLRNRIYYSYLAGVGRLPGVVLAAVACAWMAVWSP